MKCDHLLGRKFDGEVYILASDVMEAVAELKSNLDKAIAERDGNQVCIDALKQKLENVQASMYCDVVDANMENRRLKRAIWLARAERYKMKEFIAREEGNLSSQMSWSQVLRERTYNQWVDQLLRIANLANKLQNKCRAKAEKFKEADK